MVLASLIVMQEVRLDQKVDLRLPATRIEAILPKLTQTSGIRFAAMQSVREEVLVCCVEDVPLRDLIAKIAKAATATWTIERDGTYTLGRPREFEERQRKQWADKREAELKELARAFRRRALPEEKPWTEGDAFNLLTAMSDLNKEAKPDNRRYFEESTKLHERLIGGRAIARILADIDLRPIANSFPNERVVFSTHPTKAQFPLGKGAAGALREFEGEQVAMADAAKRFPRVPLSLDQVSGGLVYYTEPLARSPVAVGLTVTGRGAGWQVKLIDEKGQTLFWSHSALGQAQVPPPPQPTWLGKLASDKIPMSEQTTSVEAALIQQRRPKSWKLSPTVKAVLLDPLTYDPLSFKVSDGLHALADRRNEDLVLCVPDRLVYCPDTFGQLATQLNMTTTSGWLEASSSDFETRLTRLPRRPMKEYLEPIGRNALESIPGILALTRHGVGRVDSGWDARSRLARMYMIGLGAPTSGGLAPLVAAAIYDGLTETQRAWLAAGNAIPFGELRAAQRDVASRLLLTQTNHSLTRQIAVDGRVAYQLNQWACEPTTLWPMGIPNDAALTMKVNSMLGLLNQDEPPYMVNQLDIVAMNVIALEKTGEPIVGLGAKERFLPAVMNGFQFQITHGEFFFQAGGIGETSIDRSGAPKCWDELPQPHADAMKKSLAKQRQDGG